MTASASVLESRRRKLSPVAQEAVNLLVADIRRFARCRKICSIWHATTNPLTPQLTRWSMWPTLLLSLWTTALLCWLDAETRACTPTAVV